MKYFKRLIYRQEGEILNPLMHLFFLISFVWGLAFAFFPHWSEADHTALFQQTHIRLDDSVLSVWGVTLLCVTLVNTLVIMFRPKMLGSVTASVGFMAWVYAFGAYLLGHDWLGLFGLAIPNLLFWAWWYHKVKVYHRAPPVNV